MNFRNKGKQVDPMKPVKVVSGYMVKNHLAEFGFYRKIENKAVCLGANACCKIIGDTKQRMSA